MKEPQFLEPDTVSFLHEQALREYGGYPGVRDEVLLESALARPVNKCAYAEPGDLDLFDLAAAYAFGIARSHPFNDANKRAAWASTVLFLRINGIRLQRPFAEAVERLVSLAAGEIDEADFAAWMRHLQKAR